MLITITLHNNIQFKFKSSCSLSLLFYASLLSSKKPSKNEKEAFHLFTNDVNKVTSPRCCCVIFHKDNKFMML